MKMQFVTNAAGGVKGDGGKYQPRLLMRSMPNAIEQVCKVLTYGADKYSPNNWRLVEDDRYWDAFHRHLLADAKGEAVDSETGESHLAHALCCLFFLLEKRTCTTGQNVEYP